MNVVPTTRPVSCAVFGASALSKSKLTRDTYNAV
jgi:hypothetical protein